MEGMDPEPFQLVRRFHESGKVALHRPDWAFGQTLAKTRSYKCRYGGNGVKEGTTGKFSGRHY
jgi:hypothetical protein